MTQEFVTLPREVVERAIEALRGSETPTYRAQYDIEIDALVDLSAALEQPDAETPATAPEGWRLLPVVPTEEMLQSAFPDCGPVTANAVYRAMLDAAPQPPTTGQSSAVELPQVEQEPVGEAGSMPGTDGFTMACFRASDVPVGTKLYTRPHHRQPLNDDEILHTGIPEQLWFAKRFGSAPAGWTDEQIRTHNFFQSAVTQLVRAIERAHGIK